ncbi:MAG: hypothetical protein H7249_03810 [Chitinophagaceae bacterium]|nr:hypothetical protein [Oligoflexus sp.]
MNKRLAFLAGTFAALAVLLTFQNTNKQKPAQQLTTAKVIAVETVSLPSPAKEPKKTAPKKTRRTDASRKKAVASASRDNSNASPSAPKTKQFKPRANDLTPVVHKPVTNENAIAKSDLQGLDRSKQINAYKFKDMNLDFHMSNREVNKYVYQISTDDRYTDGRKEGVVSVSYAI